MRAGTSRMEVPLPWTVASSLPCAAETGSGRLQRFSLRGLAAAD